MSMKQANPSIRCGVSSCTFHCDEKEYCSLKSIEVEACESCNSGNPADESMCGSYKAK